jgi:hypothetical protein
LSNNFMEPWLYGQSVGLSALAVIVSAIFWTWIWGPVGLVLATPMTVCLVVFARYIPTLAVFDRLLSDQPVRQLHLWLYQRLLSGDEDEAEAIIEKYRSEHTLAETADELLLGTLVALNGDLAAGRVTIEEGNFVASMLHEIVDDLASTASEAGEDQAPPARAGTALRLIGFPARDKLDEIALNILRVLLLEESCELEVLSPDCLVGERVAAVEARKPAAVCVTSLPPGGLTATRHAFKRLRARMPGLKVIIGRLGAPQASARSAERLHSGGPEQVAATFAELKATVLRLLHGNGSAGPRKPASAPAAASLSEAESIEGAPAAADGRY